MSNCRGSYASGLGSHLRLSVPASGWPEFSSFPQLKTAQRAHRDTLEIRTDWGGAVVGNRREMEAGAATGPAAEFPCRPCSGQ